MENTACIHEHRRPIPHDDLKRLGIPAPPEGSYMSRFQAPSPPRRKRSSAEGEAARDKRSHRRHHHHKHRHSHQHDRSPGRETSFQVKSLSPAPQDT